LFKRLRIEANAGDLIEVLSAGIFGDLGDLGYLWF